MSAPRLCPAPLESIVAPGVPTPGVIPDSGSGRTRVATGIAEGVTVLLLRPEGVAVKNGKVAGVSKLSTIRMGREKLIRRCTFEQWKRANESGNRYCRRGNGSLVAAGGCCREERKGGVVSSSHGRERVRKVNATPSVIRTAK